MQPHVAPGLGNAIGSLYNAAWIGSPLIVTAGQHEIGHGLTEPMLYAPLEPMARPHVKWAVEATRLEDLPRIVRRAAKIALAPPTGPVFISLPGNVLTDDVEVDLGRRNRVEARTRPADAVLDALADRLLAARRPVVVAGHEVNTRSALAEAGELAELLGAGVYQDTIHTAAPFVSSHPCFLGALTRNQRNVAERLGAYDLLVCLGTDVLRTSVPGPPPLPPGMPVVQVGERSAEPRQELPDGAGGAGGRPENPRRPEQPAARAPARRLRRGGAGAHRRAAARELGGCARGVRPLAAAARATPMHPDRLMQVLSDALPADAVVVDEGLTSSLALPRLWAYRDERSFYGLASGGIGFAVAGAVGIRLAVPDRPVVAVIGDGSALYNIQALWTAAHLRLPLVYVIANNRGYRILKQRVRAGHGTERFVGMDFDDPPIDFAGLAAAMGVRSRRVVEPDEVGQALGEALAHPGPTLLDVAVDGRI